MLVRAMLAPQRADDSELGKRRRATKHRNEAIEFVGGDAVFRDQLRRDSWVAGAGKDLAHAQAATRARTDSKR